MNMFELTLAEMAQEGKEEMTEKTSSNYRVGYTSYETIDEARKNAQRNTARSFSPESIWQRIEETVVPVIDVTINPVDVTTTAVA